MIKSKYWNKTYEEIEYNLEEHHCPYCGHTFMVDISFCKAAPTEDYDDLRQYKQINTSLLTYFTGKAEQLTSHEALHLAWKMAYREVLGK